MNLDLRLRLFAVLLLCSCTGATVSLNRNTPADVINIVNTTTNRTYGTEDAMLLLDLNTQVRPEWNGSMVELSSVWAEFYITSLPIKGKLYQAYRMNGCQAKYPLSCQVCCTVFARDSRGQNPTCCAKFNEIGQRLYGVGDEISTVPSKVAIQETSFLWYQPPKGQFSLSNETFATFEFEVEYWRVDAPLTIPATAQDSGCMPTRANCNQAKVGDIWVFNNTLNPDILCEGGTQPCADFCGQCSRRFGPMTAQVVIEGRRHRPVVGFGGYMIAFDGGDDFLLTNFNKLPQYEFSIQFWMQQNKIRPDQTILTWWTDERTREFEITDTSNLYFYHLNNRTAKTGVSVDDGRWHHLSFSWRLVCNDDVKIPGGTYCQENLRTRSCVIDRDCLYVEILTIVDGVERARSYLPPFLPSATGQMIWGQRMVKPLKTDEVKAKEEFSAQVTLDQFDTTANLYEPFTDNQLQLMFNRLRSDYFTEEDLLYGSTSKQAERGTFTEDEPWRSPNIKYCELQGGGGFDPRNALSANIDEIRLYAYFRTPWDVNLDIDRVINAESSINTFSNPEVNQSLILYYTFDLYGDDFFLFARDDVRNIPLTIRDESPYDGTIYKSEGSLGAQNFAEAPMQVPSTAPLYGSRTVQIIVPDSTVNIPIDLINLAFDDDTPQEQLTSWIDEEPEFGRLFIGADECDTVEIVKQTTIFTPIYQQPACKGSIIGIRVLGGLGTFTSNCEVGMLISADDGHGFGALANITEVGATGEITAIEMISFGSGYDWTLANPTTTLVDSAACLCGGNPGNVPGNIDPCLQLLIHPGYADTSGAEFSAYSYPAPTVNPFATRVTCLDGVCPAAKPRPCLEACHRTLGWRSDFVIENTAPFYKDVTGPWVEFEADGFASTYWSNSQHTVWYVPQHLRQAEYYIQDESTNEFVLQDTIKDQFLIRYFDEAPHFDKLGPPVPDAFVHLWVQVIWEKLAMALNSSVAWEESSEVLIHLQVLDFDRGSSFLNAPFSVHVDRPAVGQLYQAVRITRDDPNFERDCVCPGFPRFPELDRRPETSYYPAGTRLPGARPCNVEDLGNFCMKVGEPIMEDDAIVTSFHNTRVLPGFQHARDGFFVIYAMGVGKSGVTHFDWRLKHPQGQVQEVKVDIEIRAINNRPVALNTSATTLEDQRVEILLNASDPDDPEKPTLYITEFPKHGQLYQCEAVSQSSPCALGEKISDLNETILQTGKLTVDYNGALDDEQTPVFRAVVNKDSEELQILQNSPNTSTVLTAGYGFSSYNFDPDKDDNFRKLCGGRGSVAVDILLQHPIYYTEIEIVFPIRYDTPFRLLAKRLKTFPIITYDYNVDPTTGVLEDMVTSTTQINQEGIELTQDDNQRIFFNDDGEFRAERTFASERIFCESGGVDHEALIRCQQRWDGRKYIKGEQRTVVDESRVRWFEVYRGLPHQARAAQGRISPVLTDARILAQEFRLEACGQDGRVFGVQSPNFMELLNEIRITGTFSRRPRGFVSDANRRIVYVPFHNFVGRDDFWYVAVDSAGGAKRSPAMFSLQRHRSPPAHVDIEVLATADVPQGTDVVFSTVAAGDEEWEIELSGTHPGPNGFSPVTSFEIELTESPSRGQLSIPNGTAALAQNAPTPFSGAVRYGATAGQCGVQYTSFRYRIKNVTAGDDIFSPLNTVTIQLRCRIGFWCNEADNVCEPCPVGTYGIESMWSPNSCASCPAGHFQNAVAATTCEACAPGTHNPRPRSSRCYLCPEGTKNGQFGQSHCIACPSGTYYPFKGSVECINCGPTQYTTSEGQYRCTECPLNTRSISEVGTTISYCVCTAGSYDVLGRTGRACLACPHGAYCHGRHLLPVARTGYWTSQDLWTSDGWDNSTESTAPGEAFFIPCSFRYIRGVCLGYPDVDVQEQEERCLYKDHEVRLGPSRLGIFSSEGIDVSIEPCTLQPPDVEIPGLRSWIAKQNYSTNSYCSVGYTGIICSQCASGFYRSLSGFCDHCSVFYSIPFLNLLFWGAIVGLNLLFWLFMFLAASHRARSMYIFITHAQLAAILGRLSVPWPYIAQGPLNRFALFNLDLDGMMWNCMGILWKDYSARWSVELVIPACIVAGTYLFFVYQVYFAKAAVFAFNVMREKDMRERRPRSRSTRGSIVMPGGTQGGLTRDKSGLSVEPDRASVTTRSTEDLLSDGDHSEKDSDDSQHSARSASTAASGATGSFASGRRPQMPNTKDRDVLVTLSQKDIRKLRDWGYWLTAMNINILFVMATSIVLIPWSCTTAAPTLTYLNHHPGMECHTQQHFSMKVLSVLFGVFWFLVFPITMVYILRKAWFNELVMDRKFKRQFGWLFEHYNPKYAWWEVTVVIRKAFIVCVASLLSENGYLQLMLLSIFLALHLILTFYCMPYQHRRHNVADLFLQSGYLLLVCYALTNLVGNHGLKIVNTLHGAENTNERIGILQPQPGMEEIADVLINNSFIVNVCFLAIIGLGMLVTIIMLLYDIHEIKPQAPFWAPYLYNSIFGTPLFTWEQVISQFMAVIDSVLTRIRERQRLRPPDRPASRWAHRVAVRDDGPKVEEFQSEKTVEEMLHAVVAATQEQEWSRDKVSVMNYIESLDRRIFASEMYNSKAPNLPALERERNLAKKRLLLFMHEEVGDVFKSLYDQTGRNEQALWDIQEIERTTTQKRVMSVAQKEHGKQLEIQVKEQERRVGDVKEWKAAYEKEKKRCEDLQRDVAQARDAVLLYHLESSASSEDERDLDDLLEKRITDYIDNKTAQDLCNEGKMNPMQTF